MAISPVLKWVGGKRQLLGELLPLVAKVPYERYIEPFFGGGALFFSVLPKNAIINDYNRSLMEIYEVIRDDTEDLISRLKIHEANHGKEYFYEIRGMDRRADYENLSPVERAARLLYLNKTCFNGLFRVNGKGQFNVPFGRYKHPNIVNEEGLCAAAACLREEGITISSKDYREVLAQARPGDFVYLDPPYMPISASSSFTSYTDKGFSYEEQKALKEACDDLRNRGIPFIESNSDSEEIRELYKDYDVRQVKARRSINSRGAKRGKIDEVLILHGF